MASGPDGAARPAAPGEFQRGWKVLVAALLGTACGASPLPFQTTGFFMGPLQSEFGWSRAEISLGITIYGVLGALLAPLYGAMADRYGVRPVALLSTAAFGVIFGALAFTPGSLAGFYVLWFLIGLVGIGSTPITWSRAVNLWFFKNRGLALGLTLVGTSVAALVLPPLTVTLIENFGWRTSYLLLALLPLGISLPVALAWFREPRPGERASELAAQGVPDAPQAPAATTGAAPAPASAPSGALKHSESVATAELTLQEARRGRRFWILVASIVLVSFAYGGTLVHMPQLLQGQGFSTADAALVMSLFGVAIFFGRIGTGLLLDRFWAPLVTAPILCMPALSCLVLTSDALTLPLAVAAALLLGIASGAETDLIAYLASRYFGMAHYGRIYGALYMTFGISTAVSPPVYGWVRDTTGSYDAILFVAAVMFVVGACLMLFLGRYPVFRLAPSVGVEESTSS